MTLASRLVQQATSGHSVHIDYDHTKVIKRLYELEKMSSQFVVSNRILQLETCHNIFRHPQLIKQSLPVARKLIQPLNFVGSKNKSMN